MTRAAPTQSSPLASRSVAEHMFRGLAGLVAFALAILLLPVFGPASLLLLILTAVLWRGCPTCWIVGLIGTRADARARRGCTRCSEPRHNSRAPTASD
jgi:hypothetical protein